MIRDLEQAMVQLAEDKAGEIADLERATKRALAGERHARQELMRATESDPESERIKALLQFWRTELGHPRANISVAGKRAAVVRKAIRLGHTHPKLDSIDDELMEAITGLALVPFVGQRGRSSIGEPKQRYDDVEHALRDEQTIERFRKYARDARAQAAKEARNLDDPVPLHDMYTQASAQASVYARLMFDALGAREKELQERKQGAAA